MTGAYSSELELPDKNCEKWMFFESGQRINLAAFLTEDLNFLAEYGIEMYLRNIIK